MDMRQDSIDPAVSALLEQSHRQRSERAQPQAERQRKTKQRLKAQARNRIMLDLPEWIQNRLRDIAEVHDIPISGAAAFYLAAGLAADPDITPYFARSRSPRYSWVVEIPENFEQGTPLEETRDTP